jgi:hypothetical protein
VTTSSPEQENIILAQPDPVARLSRRRAEFWQICWLISLSSLLISLYSIFLSQRLAPAASQNDLDQAALLIAQKLSSLSVTHPRFGNIGLIDIREGRKTQISFNRLQATLRLDGILARQLGLDYMYELVGRDARQVGMLSRELIKLEHELSIPATESAYTDIEPFTETVRKLLARTGAGGRLKSVKVVLGGVRKTAHIGSRAPLPHSSGERDSFFADGDSYATHIPVPIWQNLTYQFYECSDAPRLLSPKEFEALKSDDELASAVLVEANFEVAERGKVHKNRTIQSCALVGSSVAQTPSLLFMLSFPQGYFSRFASIKDIFSAQNYNTADGDWLQAFGGDIPEDGHFVSTKALDAVKPHMAAMSAFYHYLLCAGPELLPDKLKEALSQPISSLTAKSSAENSETASYQFNSGLFKDTGAARFALSKQSFRDGAGQRALESAFSAKSFQDLMPPYTFPLSVDEQGEVHLPQTKGFDRQLVKDFFDALYQTNIAGIESMQIADTIVKRMQASILQSERVIASYKEELRSLKNSIENMARSAGKDEQKLQQLQAQADSLTVSIQVEDYRKKGFEGLKKKAQLVAQNGRKAARSTYEIGSHMFSFSSRGIKRITAPFKGFLLGERSVAFIPWNNPVDEDDIYAPNDTELAEFDASNSKMWMSKNFKVTEIPDPNMYVEGKPIVDYWQNPGKGTCNRPLYVMLSSSQLTDPKASNAVFASHETAFDFVRGVIGKSQLCYYAPAAVDAGSAHKLSWSVMLRDLVFCMVDGAGKPLESSHPRWCMESGLNDEPCPQLAVEYQIRTPIPSPEGVSSGLYLQDPDGGPQVPLYPPLPAELM